VEAAKRQRDQEASARKMLLRLKNKLLYSSFAAWQDYTDDCRKRKAATKMLRRLRNQQLFQAFSAWNTWTVSS
jgi:hypothetical protein